MQMLEQARVLEGQNSIWNNATCKQYNTVIFATQLKCLNNLSPNSVVKVFESFSTSWPPT